MDEVVESQLRGEMRRENPGTSLLVVVEEIPEHRLVARLLELAGPREIRSMCIEENPVETLLHKGSQDEEPILSVDTM